MPALELVFGIVLLVLSVAMVALVLAQPGKDKHLSGAIAGNNETFFGKGKTNRWDKILSMVTVAVAIVFFVLIVVMYCIV